MGGNTGIIRSSTTGTVDLINTSGGAASTTGNGPAYTGTFSTSNELF